MKTNWMLACVVPFVASVAMAGNVQVWPLPAVVDKSETFSLSVDGVDVPVALMPEPEWAQFGHNPCRYSWARFEATGSVNVKARWKGGETNFVAKVPFFKSIEPFGRTNPLVIVADEPDAHPCRAGEPGVVYFGPGYHRQDEIVLKAGETLYLASGAWVESTLTTAGDNVKVRGRGVLSGAPWTHSKGPTPRRRGSLTGICQGKGIRVEGVTFWASFGWTLVLSDLDGVTVDNVKIINGKTGNDDGMDVVRCRNVEIRNSLVICGDDCITPKFWCEDMLVTNCTLWCDSANVVRMGYECDPPPKTFRRIVFRDIDVLHMSPKLRKPEEYWTHGLVHIDAAREQRFEDILFEDIRYHDPVVPGAMFVVLKTMPITQGYDYPTPGTIDGVTFRNFRALKGGRLAAYLSAYDKDHPVRNIRFEQTEVDKTEVVIHPEAELACIDPLIGTEGSGSQYGGMMPYTCTPFGSFQLVPMTRLNRVGQLSFNQADDTLLGFILTRQPSIWMGDWGEVRIPIEPAKIESFESTPYCGKVVAGGRKFEFTATAHAAWIRGDLREIRLLDGYNSNRDDENLGYSLPNFKGWRAVKRRGNDLQVGVSLISLEQARANLEKEIGSKSFEAVVAETKALWQEYFSRIVIDAPKDVRTIFYTGLLHTLLYPRQIDEDGRYYSAMDDKIHEGTAYNCYSLWDTYRAEHPWLTFIAPERVDGMMQSLVDMYKEGGWLPKWPNPSYTGIMIGAPAEVVLAEAYVKGFRGFDLKTAYEAVKKNATVPQEGDGVCAWEDRGQFGRTPETRGGLKSYMERGYVACDETCESVSRTQDFGLNDLSAAILAEATGHADEAALFRARAKNYTNHWNAAAQEFHPRFADGRFAPSDYRTKGKNIGWGRPAYCEQSAKTGVWAVPYDPEGLARLFGGNDVAIAKLDEFFDTVFWKGERGNLSIHGNEPSHHCAYLYNRWGAPEKTQRRVRDILTRSYSTNRKGFDGNEDCGQMSAWYIFSALGFYPIDPASGEYELGSPIVRSATLKIGAPYSPAVLRIVAQNYSPARWRVKRVTLNGRELSTWRVRHADLVKGGTLVFEMMD